MSKATEEKNKELVLEAFDTLFNQHDYIAAERYWSPKYVQHSAHIPPGREGLFNLIKNIPPTLMYEPGTIVADIVRMEDGILVEHWDVIQDEATREQSKSDLPMFREKFPNLRRERNIGVIRE